ncbi:hypothetical protein [Nostoc sp.]|uniref:hypothetical protein n=1 Tax=Nostoc sp. TaxID=1180 RepID=UPI002FFBE866
MMTQSKKFAKSQQKQYLPTQDNNAPLLNLFEQKPLPKREPIKHLLIGSPKAVTSTIHLLQVLGYANVGDWSTLLPTGNPHEVMSILSRQILMQ